MHEKEIRKFISSDLKNEGTSKEYIEFHEEELITITEGDKK